MRWFSKGTRRTLRYFPKTTAAVAAFNATEGRFAGGVQSNLKSSTFYSDIAEFEIASGASYSQTWGTLSQSRSRNMGLASQVSGSRLVSAGGVITGAVAQNTIDYHEFSTGGSATDFGDLIEALFDHGGFSSATTGYRLGGTDNSTVKKNTIAKITFASPGNESSFATLSETKTKLIGFHTSTHGFSMGGRDSTNALIDDILKFEIASESIVSETFGTLSAIREGCSCGGNETRIITSGGVDNGSLRVNTIEYIEAASGGAVTDFGDMQNVKEMQNSSPSSQTTMIMSYGNTTAFSYYRNVEQVTIASPGNATTFATHSQNRGYTGAYSGTP